MSSHAFVTSVHRTDRYSQIVHAFLETMLPAPRPFAVRLWDGTTFGPEPARDPLFTFVLNRPGTLRRLLFPPSDLNAGEAYVRGDWDVKGDLEIVYAHMKPLLLWPLHHPRLITLLLQLPSDDLPPGDLSRRRWHPHGRARSLDRDRQAVTYHYNAGNDFYALWLDRRMVYSCAYFPTGTEDIDQAQEAKLDLICRKLRLQPGERLLDIGCGWGGLIQYAAERYGVEAVGITLSEPQAQLARQRIAAAGLDKRCRIKICDYRTIDGFDPFDKAVSVGMYEHVGRNQLPAYFGAAWRALKPGGLFLHHGISNVHAGSRLGRRLGPLLNHWSFMWQYVFPDGELSPLTTILEHADQTGFEPRDVENLREHYAETLRHWGRRLEAHHDEIVQLGDETLFRIWKLYMAACAYLFESASINIYQVLLAKLQPNGHIDLPRSRADLYWEEPAPVRSDSHAAFHA